MKKREKSLSKWGNHLRFLLMCALFFSFALSAVAQVTVKGRVVDASNVTLAGVTVAVKSSKQGTMTDVTGDYELKVDDANATLIFSYIGFHTQEIPLKGQTSLNVTMIDNTKLLEEVIVVGYGTQKKVNLTGAVQNVKSEDLVKRNASNTANALQGLIPGVSVVQSSGKPGADAGAIKIRGTGSLNSSTGPLVIIDGMEGDMNYLDMNSVESISVLKDAASASIYGSKASNGVILVTTKRGGDGSLKVSYSGYVGYNRPLKMPSPVSAIEYMEAINHATANAKGTNIPYPETLINEYKTLGSDNLTRYDTDWRDLVIEENALTHNNSLSLSGGSKQLKFYANAGHYYQDGNIANNNYKRSTLKVNTDAKITKWMNVGLDLGLRESKVLRSTYDTPEAIIAKALTFVPLFSAIHDDGTWGNGQNGDNPLASAKASGKNTSTSPEITLKGYISINPLDGWNIMTSYSTRRLETKSDYFLSPFDTYHEGQFKEVYPPGGKSKYEGWSKATFNQFNLQSSYEKQLASHYFNVLAGLQTEEVLNRDFSTTRLGHLFPGYEEINHGDANSASNTGSRSELAMRSFFGRLNYNFQERYLLEFNARWDATSRFMKGNRTGFFPSVSGGWRISEESFFSPMKDVVNNLKLRASYGTLGNQDIKGANPFYPYAATIASGYNYYFNKVLTTGYTQNQLANPFITWEESSQLNFGIDINLFNSKLVFSGDYFVRKINDMLQQFEIPMYTGMPSPWENAGDMKNTGWELTASWRDKIQNVGYFVTFNLSDVKNKMTNLHGNKYTTAKSITTEGLPMYSWYGYLSDGYYQNQGDIDNSPALGVKDNVKMGDIRYKDINGPDGTPDGIIDDHDRTVIGDPTPRYEYSINLGVDWKGIDFSMFFQGVGKRDVFYDGYGSRPFIVGRSAFKYQLDSWAEDNRDAKFPLLLIDGSNNLNNNRTSDFWVKSGAYLRLKNIVLGYTLPKNATKKIGLQHVRFYASAQNLFTISNSFYKGFDPETFVNNGQFYPLMKTYTFGVNIDF